MFSKIATDDLYFVELKTIVKISDVNISNFSETSRYSIAQKIIEDYIDIFTGNKYINIDSGKIGDEVLYDKKSLISDIEYLTYEEADCVLQSFQSYCEDYHQDEELKKLIKWKKISK